MLLPLLRGAKPPRTCSRGGAAWKRASVSVLVGSERETDSKPIETTGKGVECLKKAKRLRSKNFDFAFFFFLLSSLSSSTSTPSGSSFLFSSPHPRVRYSC